MVLSNKAILSYFGFNFPLSLMLFQAFCTALILDVLRRLGKNDCETIKWSTAKKVMPLNFMFVAMICSSSYATEYLSVPFLTIFKNLTNVAITYGESRLYGKRVSSGVLLSISIMIGGSFCAAFNDIEFSREGYFWMFINCCVTACYVLYMKWAMDATRLSKDSMALYNNLIGVPIILALVLIQEPDVIYFPNYNDMWFEFILVSSGFVGYAMSLATFYAISKTTPTTYSMVGALNKIPASILGAIFFEAVITAGGWFGITIGLCGGIVFAWVKATEGAAAAAVIVSQDPEDDGDDKEVKELISPTDRRF
jgi:GDP-mannose transporter